MKKCAEFWQIFLCDSLTLPQVSLQQEPPNWEDVFVPGPALCVLLPGKHGWAWPCAEPRARTAHQNLLYLCHLNPGHDGSCEAGIRWIWDPAAGAPSHDFCW